MTIPFDRALSYTRGAVRVGVPVDKLLELALVNPGAACNSGLVNKPQLLLLHLAVMNGARDESHGLAEEPIPLGTTSLALCAMLGSFDLDRALTSFAQIYNLTASTVRVQKEVGRDQVTLTIRCGCSADSAALLLEDTMINWLWGCVSRYLNEPLPVVKVTTRDPAHPNLGSRHWVCGARLKLGAAASITFARSWLRMRGRASPSKDATFQCYLRALQFVQARDRQGDVVSHSLQSLAEREGTSKTTMRRRLSTYYGGYRASRETVIIDGALSLLSETNHSVDAIAMELGYSDARSFRRFFKSALGLTPQEFRKSGQAGFREESDNMLLLARLRELTTIFDRLPVLCVSAVPAPHCFR